MPYQAHRHTHPANHPPSKETESTTQGHCRLLHRAEAAPLIQPGAAAHCSTGETKPLNHVQTV